ncbi:hypothetical protein HA402_012861 [Bradysia odoriphaga]|nr:hypothetical protein HA402_012861 [Bradysia odoriphaga]
MWDQRRSINVSAPEGSERISGSNLSPIQDKKIFESSGGDSGFLSGPQNSSDSLDSEIYSHKSILPDSNKFQDSGAIVGDDEEEDEQADTKDPMIFRSGIDVGLSEWMCDLNLKDSTINNLSSSRKTAEEAKPTKLSKQLPNRQLWEICYVQDADGDTQLHLAILGKYVQAVQNIIRLAPVPAFLDIRNDDAHSPLHLAVLTRQPHIVRCLIIAGAKGSTQDKSGNTPLHLACMNSDKVCVEALTLPVTREELQRFYNCGDRIPQVLYPDVELRNYDGIYCVHIAAQRNNIDILRHLVWLGADINAREGKSGYTALHFACENGNEELAQFLLSECNQLNVETCTYGLLTAYQLAAEQNNRNLMGNLKRYGAELLSPPESDDEYFNSSDEEDYDNFGSDGCEMEMSFGTK